MRVRVVITQAKLFYILVFLFVVFAAADFAEGALVAFGKIAAKFDGGMARTLTIITGTLIVREITSILFPGQVIPLPPIEAKPKAPNA
jgi:hypothetical protein